MGLAEELVEGLLNQELAALMDAAFIVGVGGGDDDPDDDASVVAVARLSGEGADLVFEPSAGRSAAAADLSDQVVVPCFEATQVSRRILVSWKDATRAEEDRSEGQGEVCPAGAGALAGVLVGDRGC